MQKYEYIKFETLVESHFDSCLQFLKQERHLALSFFVKDTRIFDPTVNQLTLTLLVELARRNYILVLQEKVDAEKEKLMALKEKDRRLKEKLKEAEAASNRK